PTAFPSSLEERLMFTCSRSLSRSFCFAANIPQPMIERAHRLALTRNAMRYPAEGRLESDRRLPLKNHLPKMTGRRPRTCAALAKTLTITSGEGIAHAWPSRTKSRTAAHPRQVPKRFESRPGGDTRKVGTDGGFASRTEGSALMMVTGQGLGGCPG